MILWLFLSAMAFGAAPDLNIELGEDSRLLGNFSKIWVEDRQIIQILQKQNTFFVKALKPGITHYRLDNVLRKVIVSPLGSRKALNLWSKLKNNFVGLQADYCNFQICLTGTLYRLRDYQRIIELIKENPIAVALQVHPSIENELRTFIEQSLRKKGITPLKVNFGAPWKVFRKEKFSSEYEAAFTELGIQPAYRPNSTEIADNIKVAVRVAEITKNFERKLGVRWPDSYQAQIVNSQLISENTFEVAIQAAEKAGEAKILASPNLICRSGKEADFFAGGEFPIKVLGLRSKEIQWKRYGIGLKLKPLIDPSGQMSLHIETEVSTLDRSISVDDIPALHTNRVSSFFDLIGSRTIAISGLIKSEVSENSEGVPFLKNIPILGALFTSKNFQENKSELVIFVTPELME